MDEMRDGFRGQGLIKGRQPELSTGEVMLLSFVGIHEGFTVTVAEPKSGLFEFLFISVDAAEMKKGQSWLSNKQGPAGGTCLTTGPWGRGGGELWAVVFADVRGVNTPAGADFPLPTGCQGCRDMQNELSGAGASQLLSSPA